MLLGTFMRLPYEKHVKYINLIEVKHNSLVKEQQRQYIQLNKNKIYISPCCSA